MGEVGLRLTVSSPSTPKSMFCVNGYVTAFATVLVPKIMIPVSIIIAANIVANDFLKLLISTPSFLSNVPLEIYKAPLNILMVFDKIFKEISCSNKFFYFNLGQRLRKLTKLRSINATKCVDLTSFLLARKTCTPSHSFFHFFYAPSKKLAGVYASAKNNSSVSTFCKK